MKSRMQNGEYTKCVHVQVSREGGSQKLVMRCVYTKWMVL